MTTVRVSGSTSPTAVRVSQGNRATSSVVVKRAPDLTLESLKDVVTTDLNDGYTILYDADSDKWIASPVDDLAITSLDGGTY